MNNTPKNALNTDTTKASQPAATTGQRLDTATGRDGRHVRDGVDEREALTWLIVGCVADDVTDPGVEVHLRSQDATEAIIAAGWRSPAQVKAALAEQREGIAAAIENRWRNDSSHRALSVPQLAQHIWSTCRDIAKGGAA